MIYIPTGKKKKKKAKQKKINSFIKLQSANVVYLLRWPCGMTYVGQTKKALSCILADIKQPFGIRGWTMLLPVIKWK